MTDSKLLPLQFRSCVDPDQSYDVIDFDGERIMSDCDTCLMVPNAKIAKLMVKATNSHDKLIAALKIAQDLAIDMADDEYTRSDKEIIRQEIIAITGAVIEESTHG